MYVFYIYKNYNKELAVKRDIETEDLIKDLRKQVQKLTKENSKLNSKVVY